MSSVVRTGRSFRVILNGKDGQSFMLHSFAAIVVEIDVRNFDFGREALGDDRKSVIVRSDFNVSGAQIFDRLISAAMTEKKFVSRAPESAS